MHQAALKHLLIAAALLLPGAGRAGEPEIQCPGNNTVEMRYCAGVLLDQSNAALLQKIPAKLFQRWQATTREVCAHAYRAYLEGTIYPQLVVGCDDRLNRALLNAFEPLNNQAEQVPAP